jgi:hypothetical protein
MDFVKNCVFSLRSLTVIYEFYGISKICCGGYPAVYGQLRFISFTVLFFDVSFADVLLILLNLSVAEVATPVNHQIFECFLRKVISKHDS